MQPLSASGHAIQDQLLTVFLFLGSGWVLWLLLALSVISIAIAFERLVHFVRHADDKDALYGELELHLGKGDAAGAMQRLSQSRSHSAVIVKKGLEAEARGPGAIEEVIAGAVARERLAMERGLAFLGTLGNNAPYIGLFGTVLGIIRSFRDLSTNTIEGSAAVMAGIAEALVATGVGLLVALPAVAVFNFFQRKIRLEVQHGEAMSRLVLAHVKTKRT